MTLPVGIQTVRLTFGRRFNLLGNAASLSGTFELDQDLLWAATGDVLERFATPATFNQTTGLLEFDFPTSDQPGFEDGAGHSVTGFKGILRASVGSRSLPPITFQVFAADVPGPVDLDYFLPASLVPSVAAQTTYVRSVAGLSGPVSGQALADALAPYLPSPTPQDTGSVTIPIPNSDGGSLVVQRIGFETFWQFAGDWTGSGSSLSSIIPSGFRPSSIVPGLYFNVDTGSADYVNFSPDGNLSNGQGNPFGSTQGSGSFPAAGAFPQPPFS